MRMTAIGAMLLSLTAAAQNVVDPPGAEESAVKQLIDRAIEDTRAPSALLADEAYLPAHEYVRFREEIRRRATAKPLTIVTPREPGTRLRVRGTVRDAQGKPVPGALMYAYQTDHRGWYSGYK